jgi:hypothetical protein
VPVLGVVSALISIFLSRSPAGGLHRGHRPQLPRQGSSGLLLEPPVARGGALPQDFGYDGDLGILPPTILSDLQSSGFCFQPTSSERSSEGIPGSNF